MLDHLPPVNERNADGLTWEATGSGPGLLLIHAGIADRTMWDPQWELWRDRFRLVRYDQRGFGDSSDPEAPYSLHEDAIAVLNAAGLARAAVIGASMGGKAALDLALAHPERIEALVTVAATPSGWEHEQTLVDLFESVDEAYEREGIEAANEIELRMWVDGPSRGPGDVDQAVRGRVAEMNRSALLREEAREESGANPEPAALDPPALNRLGEVHVPTLVVTGELDQPSVNAGAAAIANGVSGARAVAIAGAAHLPNLERPLEFATVVEELLDPLASGAD